MSKQKRNSSEFAEYEDMENPITLAECISKITVTPSTPEGTLHELEQKYDIHAEVVVKKK